MGSSCKPRDALSVPDNVADAFQQFSRSHPRYAETAAIDEVRARDYRRLDESHQVYLDYTGGGLYADSQITAHLELLRRQVFGNPHSSSPSSLAATVASEEARDDVLRHFHASSDEYVVIFTPNASGALKTVAESYPFGEGSHLVLTADNHNSVNGLREYAAARGAHITYIPLEPDLRLDEAAMRGALAAGAGEGPSLLAYPAQSNFSGVQHDLQWIDVAQRQGFDVLLDAAAFVPTNHLDLSVWHPDFIGISFYKMFGYPTGIGCLLARKSALKKLVRPWYAGGTVAFASVKAFAGTRSAHRLLEGPSAFEDGTIDYLGIPSVSIGLRHIEAVGLDLIHRRVMMLTDWLLDALASLRHRNGQPLCEIYGPPGVESRGGIVLFNLLDPKGAPLYYEDVQSTAGSRGISVRSGCHCNPGAREAAMHLGESDLRASFANLALPFDEFMTSVADKMDGAIRASVGIASNFEDVYSFYTFISSYRT